MEKITFALYFGNRGFFPGELIADARKDMAAACRKNGYGYIAMDESLTRYGAVETISEGETYAKFLKENEGKYNGIIVCLPNFGDENGAYYALKDASVPILIQAYPDEIGKMDFAHRRDAVCGKIAMCNVFRQANIKYTLTEKFAVNPSTACFAEDLRKFAGICRVVNGMKSFNIGAIGARTTAFKTVRVDEIAMQRKHINVETIDLARVFAMMDTVDETKLAEKKEHLKNDTDFGTYADIKLENIARLAVTIDELIAEYRLHSIAIRCWDEIQKRYGVAPCVILGDLNEKGIVAACELDINNAVMMRALMLASDHPVMLYDANNNYGECEKKVIFFHCGPSPKSMLKGRGRIEEHLMFKKIYGPESGVGLRVDDVQNGEVTIGSCKTEDGKIRAFATEGTITDDTIEKAFFGCGCVFEKKTGTADEMLNYMSSEGYRHHVAIAKGNWNFTVKEAFETYLGYNIDII